MIASAQQLCVTNHQRKKAFEDKLQVLSQAKGEKTKAKIFVVSSERLSEGAEI